MTSLDVKRFIIYDYQADPNGMNRPWHCQVDSLGFRSLGQPLYLVTLDLIEL